MLKIVGFTLIEVLIVIAIIGILASIAYPSFQSYTQKARRGDAKSELVKAQLQQNSLHILNPSYSMDENELGLKNNDYYIFSVISATSTTYSMQAVAQGTQIQDAECLILTINQNNQQSPTNCW